MIREIANRDFIVLNYKEPYIQWAEQWNELGDDDLKEHLRDPRLYIVELYDHANSDDYRDLLGGIYNRIFENELSGWNCNRKEWPQNRNIEVFFEWFEISKLDCGYDLCADKIEYEEYLF